jgi:fluoride exporter
VNRGRRPPRSTPRAALTAYDVDPDLDPRLAAGSDQVPAEGGERPGELRVVAAIALGGVVGAESRHGIALALPSDAAGFPWSTLVVNASGCLLLGVLMAVLAAARSPHPLARPFLGVGAVGGFTTFSTFAVDVDRLLRLGRPSVAAAYLLATVAACAGTVWAATAVSRRAVEDREAADS